MKNIAMKLGTLGLLGTMLCAPLAANARTPDRLAHRQDTKNTWRNTTVLSAAVGLLGLASHNNALTAIGAAGALYSGFRYDEDRRSEQHIADFARRRDDRNDNRRDDRRDNRNDRDQHADRNNNRGRR